jgi:hypothetical protein
MTASIATPKYVVVCAKGRSQEKSRRFRIPAKRITVEVAGVMPKFDYFLAYSVCAAAVAGTLKSLHPINPAVVSAAPSGKTATSRIAKTDLRVCSVRAGLAGTRLAGECKKAQPHPKQSLATGDDSSRA